MYGATTQTPGRRHSFRTTTLGGTMNDVKTQLRDPATQLKTRADVAGYFEACINEGGDDAEFLLHALSVIVRADCMQPITLDMENALLALAKTLSEEDVPTLITVFDIGKALGLTFGVRKGV